VAAVDDVDGHGGLLRARATGARARAIAGAAPSGLNARLSCSGEGAMPQGTDSPSVRNETREPVPATYLCSPAPGTAMSALRYAPCACQTALPTPRDRTGIADTVGHMLGMIDRAVLGYAPFAPVRLVAFPEFAHAAPVYPTAEELLDRLAVPIPNEHTDRYCRKAQEHGVFVQTGTFLERDDRFPGHVFNTTCLIGPDGLLSRYRKVHPWLPWEVHTSPHDLPGYSDPLFPVVETEIGRLGAAVCYDWLFPEAIRMLALGGAEVLIRVSAYMDPWGATPPMDWWTLLNRARAV